MHVHYYNLIFHTRIWKRRYMYTVLAICNDLYINYSHTFELEPHDFCHSHTPQCQIFMSFIFKKYHLSSHNICALCMKIWGPSTWIMFLMLMIVLHVDNVASTTDGTSWKGYFVTAFPDGLQHFLHLIRLLCHFHFTVCLPICLRDLQ